MFMLNKQPTTFLQPWENQDIFVHHQGVLWSEVIILSGPCEVSHCEEQMQGLSGTNLALSVSAAFWVVADVFHEG